MRAVLMLDDGAKLELTIAPVPEIAPEDTTTALYECQFNGKRFTFESIPAYPWIVLADAMMVLDQLGWIDGNCTL